ncbi:tripartite tricarboxylate transporter substrate binding protein [Micromonospora sp. NPDC092111]|uniref:tripartite tricarboxylate transporter substrate binding protein n=1 Tax=Micromonospora sp. NPDC092111 TaxID=3364289 RepID=UPI003813D783
MKRNVRRIACLLAAPLLLAACATTAPSSSGQEPFPKSLDSITLIVPFSAGGSTDTVARLVAPRLESELGVPVQVLNKPEGNGQVGLKEVAKAPTDGSVLGSVNLPSVITSYLDPNTDVDYDRKSFQPVGAVTGFGVVLVASADGTYKSFEDLAKAVHEKPRSVNLAAGAVDDLLPMSYLEKAFDGKFNLVPFEGGSSGKVTALLGKKVDVIIAAPSAVVANVQSGKFRILATLGSQRTVTFPDVPTATELGYKIIADTVNGFALPAGTPDDIVQAYSRALEKAVADPKFVDAVGKLGFNTTFLDPRKHAELWDRREQEAAPVIAAAG